MRYDNFGFYLLDGVLVDVDVDVVVAAVVVAENIIKILRIHRTL